MRSQKRRVMFVAFVLLVSIFGLAISATLLGNPVSVSQGPANRRAIIALVYDSVCLAGMVAALFPAACSGTVRSRPSAEKQEDV
ncbi:MAG: hypothetical protein WCC94_11945, partial [Candidatus Bathyarchaeia archaeon]